jgi:hypothetical protein
VAMSGSTASAASWNPYGIGALVVVDLDPRWTYDHTCTTQAAGSSTGVAMARVVDAVSFLGMHVWDKGLPIIPVHTDTRHFYDLLPIRGSKAAVCGVYGGLCVKVACEWLEQAWDIQPIRILDAIVWPGDIDPQGIRLLELFPQCDIPSWAVPTLEQITIVQ